MPYAHMKVKEGALVETGYSVDDLNTFADVLKFSNDWAKTHGDKGAYVSMNETCPAILTSYLLSHYDYEMMFIDVDNSEFRDLLSSIKALMLNHGLGDIDSVGFSNIPHESLPIYIGQREPIYSHGRSYWGEMSPVPLPLVDHETPGKRSIDSSFYVINPYSDHIDVAMELMAQIGAMSKLPIAINDLLYQDMASYNEEGFGDASVPSMISFYDKEEIFKKMGRFWEQHELYFAFPGLNDLLGICDEYLKDAVSLDEAIEKMEHIIDIVRRENLK